MSPSSSGNNASATDNAELAQGATVSVAGRVSGRGLLLLTQITIGRFFGPEAFGLYAVGWTVLRLTGLVSLLGMDTALVRYGARSRVVAPGSLRQVVRLGIGIPVVLGAALGGSIYLAAPALAASVFHKSELAPVLRWFSLGVAASAGLQAAAAATRIAKEMKYAVLSEDLAQPALGLALVLLFAWLGWGIGGAAAASVVSLIAGMGVALLFVRRLSPPPSAQPTPIRRLAKELMGFSLTIFGARFFLTVINWVDRLVLGSLRPAAEVGIYQAAVQSSALFAIILGAIINILAPIAADLWHRGELARLQGVFRTSTKWGLYLSLPLIVVMWSAPQQILSVVFGPDYVRGAAPLVLLVGGQLINAATGGVGLLLSMTGNHVIWARTAGAMFGLDVLLNLFLVPRLGLLGAAIATSVAISGVFLIGLFQVWRLLGMWPYDWRYLKGLAAAACSAGAAYLVGRWAGGGSWVGLVGLTLAAVAVFGGVLLALGPDAEDREFLGLLQSRLGRAVGASGADSQ